MRLFEVIDRKNRLIYLTSIGWKHICSEHPDIVNDFERIKDTVLRPLLKRKSYDETTVGLYYKYYKDKREYLIVIAKYLNGEGFVLTSFYIEKINKSF